MSYIGCIIDSIRLFLITDLYFSTIGKCNRFLGDLKMLDLFGYYNPKDTLVYKSILSAFISESNFWYKNKSELISVDGVNATDRVILAHVFIEDRKNNYNQGVHCKCEPIRDVAMDEAIEHISQYIDLVIPRHYMVLLKEQEIGVRINRSEYRKSYTGINCVPDSKFAYKDNYAREIDMFNTRANQTLHNKEFSELNYPYQQWSNATLYRMVVQDAKVAGYRLLKKKNELSRFTLLALLHNFFRGRPMEDLNKYVKLVKP